MPSIRARLDPHEGTTCLNVWLEFHPWNGRDATPEIGNGRNFSRGTYLDFSAN